MVKAIIDISSRTNKMLMIVKATHGLRDKSQAINKMAEEYEELIFEPVRLSYLKRLKKIGKEKSIKLGDAAGFMQHYDLH